MLQINSAHYLSLRWQVLCWDLLIRVMEEHCKEGRRLTNTFHTPILRMVASRSAGGNPGSNYHSGHSLPTSMVNAPTPSPQICGLTGRHVSCSFSVTTVMGSMFLRHSHCLLRGLNVYHVGPSSKYLNFLLHFSSVLGWWWLPVVPTSFRLSSFLLELTTTYLLNDSFC